VTNIHKSEIEEIFEGAIEWSPPLDKALIGYGFQFNYPVAIYDYNKCIQALVQDGMTIDEAVEYFDYNVSGAWLGHNTPIIVHTSIAEEHNNWLGL